MKSPIIQSFKCEVNGFPTRVYAAYDKGSARFKCWKAARDAGYAIGFQDVYVVKLNKSESDIHP